jgi:D-arabinono-1,4-lactone oxidase
MWWPQKGSNRIVTWSAERTYDAPETPTPYHEFSPNGFVSNLEQMGAAILYSILGIKGIIQTLANIYRDFVRFATVMAREWSQSIGHVLAALASFLVTLVLGVVFFIPIVLFIIFKPITKALLPVIINLIQPLSSDKNPIKEFYDYYYRSLPMDNEVDDIMMGTEFTEIWIPIQYTQQVMNLLNDHYKKNGYSATGAFSNELYAGHPTSYWMHQGYTNGEDEFKDGTIRVDLFWYTANTGTPNGRGEYYDQFWKLFRDNNIPFRLHWGKFVPDYDFKDWASYYETQLPKMKEFLELREQRDPHNIFLTDYWKLRLYGSLK